MRLEIANYPVQRAVAGMETFWRDGVLEIDTAALAAHLGQDSRLAAVRVALVLPGESVRLARIIDMVEPRVKVAGPAGDFPGVLSPMGVAGSGRTHALKHVAITTCDPTHAEPFPMLDMGGDGTRHSDYAALPQVVLSAEPAPGVSVAEFRRGLYEAQLRLAVMLAGTTLEHEPADVEVFDLPPMLAPAPAGLPRVGYIFMLRSHQRLTLDGEPILYGSDTRGLLPTLLHPNEVLDGAVLNGYWLFQNETRSIQNHPVVRALATRHGRELWFSGVIATIAPATEPARDRTVAMAVRLAADVLGLDGVIITKTGGGMPETDLMMLADGCEAAGVKTALVAWERLTNGHSESPLTVFSPRADAIASMGDRDAALSLPPVARVIGGRDASDAGEQQLALYQVLGGVNQLGASYLTAVER